MDHRIIFGLVLLIGVSICLPAFAEEDAPQEEGQGMGMMKDKKKMKGMMGGMHQQPSMIATSDGGVVVLAGPKLMKYDASLNLVGEAELKMGPKPGSHEHQKQEGGEQPV